MTKTTAITCPECRRTVEKDIEGYIRPHGATLVYADGRRESGSCPASRTFHFEGQTASSIRAIPTSPPGSGKKRK